MQRGPQMFRKWCNPPFQLSFVPIAFPHGWHGFHLPVHRCPPDSSPQKKSSLNNWRLSIDFYSYFQWVLQECLYKYMMFSHQKKSGPWNFGRWIFPSLPFPTPWIPLISKRRISRWDFKCANEGSILKIERILNGFPMNDGYHGNGES